MMSQSAFAYGERRSARRGGKQAFLRLRLSDAEDLEKLLGPGSECSHLSLEPLEAEASVLQTSALRITTHRSRDGFRLEKAPRTGWLSVAYVARAASAMHRGCIWGNGDLLVPAGAGALLHVLGPAEVTWIDVDLKALPKDLAELLERALRGDGAVLNCGEPAIADLRRHIATMIALHLDGVPAERVRRQELDFLDRLRRALCFARPKTRSVRRERAFDLLERVEAFMWNNIEDTLTLDRICQVVTCRARTLTYSFKAIAGIGPMTYLKIRRLERAHRRLQASTGGERVFDIAADFGFWHMGHFGADYKRLFGTTPSETRTAERAHAV